MLQNKLSAALFLSLSFFSSASFAQEQQSDNLAKSNTPSQLKPQTQTPQLKSQPAQEVYGPYVPYVAPTPKAAPPRGEVAGVPPPLPSCTPNAETSSQPSPPRNEVYGAYVPYTGPPLKPPPPKCKVADVPPAASYASNAQPVRSTPTHPNFSAATPKPSDLTLAIDAAPTATSPSPVASTSEYVRIAPAPPPVVKVPREIRPFRSVAIGFKADTLGLGIEVATPVSHRLNLRSSFNIFAFNDPFSIDGVNYEARLHLQSSETTLDWFPVRGFHISPGILYLKNSMSAPAYVAPGQTFVLGSQTFINSVDDPVSGTSSVVYPHTYAPMLLLGVGNIIPRSGRHLSVPFEFGAAYTGSPQINVALSGTACTTNGCVSFARSPQAQANLKQEIYNLNEDLKRFPIFPIVSLGLAYHF